MTRFEFTGGLEDFTSEEASADAGNRDEAGSNAPAIEAVAAESSPAEAPWRSPEEVAEARAAYDRFQQVCLEDFPSEEGSADAGDRDETGLNALAIEAFPAESSPAPAPSRSPAEVAEAETTHDDRVQHVDSLGRPTGDSAVARDTAPVDAPSGVYIGATDSELSTAATRPPLFRYRWLTMAAAALLLLAAVTAILIARAVPFFRPADGSGVYTSTPHEPATPAAASVDSTAAASPQPVLSVDADRTARAPGVTPPSDDRATTGAKRLSSDRPVDTTAGRREDAPAQLAPAPSLNATGPARDAAPIAAPPPTPPDKNAVAPVSIAAAPLPDANTVDRTEVPSVPAPSTDTARTPPPISGREAAVPGIPPAALAERGDAAAEAAAVEGINATLRRLQLAYEQRDARLAKAVWPTVNERALARAFEGLRSQRVTFDRCRMNVVSVSADVECRGVMNYVPRVGSQDPRTESRQWTFRVRKGDDQWLITNAEAR